MRHAGWWTIRALEMAFLLAGVGAWCQAAPEKESKPAANAWMLTPTPYRDWNKGVSPEIRAARDDYSDRITPPAFAQPVSNPPRRLPLTSPGFYEYVTPSGCDGAGSGPEIRNHPNGIVLAARFTKYRSVLSASGYSLYSELTLNVEQVFEDRSGSGYLALQREMTVLVPGGTITLPSGKTLSYKTGPREWSLQPEHSYLMVLAYYKEGDFYLVTDDWDISDGVTRPNDCRTDYWERTGRSSLSGLSVQQLGPVLEKLLYSSQ